MSQSTLTAINWMDRDEIVAILEGYGFAVYDDESEADLRTALISNVEDGTIDELAVQ